MKHEFFGNVWKGTLNNLVHALGGLFVLNIPHKDSQQYLLKMGVIQMGDFDRRLVYWRSDEKSWRFFLCPSAMQGSEVILARHETVHDTVRDDSEQ